MALTEVTGGTEEFLLRVPCDLGEKFSLTLVVNRPNWHHTERAESFSVEARDASRSSAKWDESVGIRF